MMIKTRKIKESPVALIMLIAAPLLTFYLLEGYTHNPFKTMSVTAHLLNYFLFITIALLLFALIGRLHIALIIETLFFAVYGLINYYVLNFRSVPVQPWDLFSLRTAANVAENYNYMPDFRAILIIAGFLVLILLEALSRYSLQKKGWKFRLPAACIFAIFLTAFCLMFRSDEIVQKKLKLYDKLFTPTTISLKNGTALTFLMELRYITVEKPQGYNEAEASTALSALETDPVVPEELPNIIVIMDEAFSDPSVLGEFHTNQDYMPFLHSMMDGAENTISGWLNVSVLGGNTANTEFEYLTGHTLAFLPAGSVAYQQFIHSSIDSMASLLGNLGYRTVASHPYSASGWNRDQVYPLLGFSETLFLDDFRNAEKIRKYVSDRADFQKIIEIYETKEKNEPLFLFNVTMQNHSSYTENFSNFHPDVEMEGTSPGALNNYLSLLRLSDQALQELISYFETQEEDTIVVFFGDHQPNNSVIEPILNANGKTSASLSPEEEAARYLVPFMIWANFDIQESAGIETSANYLGLKTLETAGLPLSGYWNYLSSLSASVPVITSGHIKLNDGTLSNTEEYPELFTDYRIFQYYLLFHGSKN